MNAESGTGGSGLTWGSGTVSFRSRSARIVREEALGIDAVKWSQISAHWANDIIRDPRLGLRFKEMCDREMAWLEGQTT